MAVLDHIRHDLQQDIIEPLMQSVSPDRRAAGLLNQLVALNQSGRFSHLLLLARLTHELVRTQDPVAQKLAAIVRYLLDTWAGFIADAQTAGSIRRSFEPQNLAQLLLSALFGAVTTHELEDSLFSLPSVAQQLQILLQP